MSPVYLRQVESPFKGGVQTTLGYRTLIVGPSWSGKSAITNAVEFLLTGRVSDIVGRDTVADVNQLLTLGPGDELWARGVLSDDRALELRLRGKKVPPSPFPQALPLREVREALAGSVETTRKFFLRMSSGAVTLEDVENRIPGPYRELFSRVIAATQKDTAPVDLLLFALERAKARAREILNEAKASTTVVTETTQGLEPASSADLTNARSALESARAAIEKLTLELETARRATKTLGEADEAALLVVKLTEELQRYAGPVDVDRVRENLLEVLRYAEAQKLVSCPCCRQEPSVKVSLADFWTQRLAVVQAKHKEREEEFGRHLQASAALTEARLAQTRAENALAAFQRDGAEHRDVSELEAKLDVARGAARVAEERVIRLERTQAAWEQAKKARDAAAERELEAGRWEHLAEACKVAVGELMDQATKTFVEKVQKFLPVEKRFFLQLRDGEREVCRYGFVKSAEEQGDATGAAPELYTIALSGGEWALLCAALTAAYLGEKHDETAPYVIIPEDRQIDAHALVQVMGALEAAPCQVILATTTEPARIPNGWTVVRTSPAAAEWRGTPGVTTKKTADGGTVAHVDPAAAATPAAAAATPPGLYIRKDEKPCPHGVQGGYCAPCLEARNKRIRKPKAEKKPPEPPPDLPPLLQ